MKRSSRIVLLCLSLACGGCFPRELVVWSPDGRTAAVILGEELRFCDAEGDLTDRVAEDVYLVRWFSDGRRLLLATKAEAESWREVVAAIGEQRAAALARQGDELKDQLLAAEDWTDAIEAYKTAHKLSDSRRDAILLYLRDRHIEELRRASRYAGDSLASEPAIHSVVVRALADGVLGQTTALFASVSMIGEALVAPDDAAVALVAGNALWIARSDGAATARLVAEKVSRYGDWSPDGRSIVCARIASDDGFTRGELALYRIRGRDGALPAELPDPETLAIVVPDGDIRTRCLADGRVLFATIEVDLPIGPRDVSGQMHLFAVDPARRPTVARVIPRSVIDEHLRGADMHFFQVSPDEKRVAITMNDGRVVVVTLATGEVAEAQPAADPDKKIRMAPTWRSNEELTCLRPAGGRETDSPRPEIVLWSTAGTTTLSADWPDELLDALRPEDKTDKD